MPVKSPDTDRSRRRRQESRGAGAKPDRSDPISYESWADCSRGKIPSFSVPFNNGDACVQLRGNTLAHPRSSIRRFSSTGNADSVSGSSQRDLSSKAIQLIIRNWGFPRCIKIDIRERPFTPWSARGDYNPGWNDPCTKNSYFTTEKIICRSDSK